MIRVLALGWFASISACDPPLFFFSEPEPPRACDYQIELRCGLDAAEGIFASACRPKLTIDQTCAFLVDASACDPAFSFSGEIGEAGIRTDGCATDGFTAFCGECEVAFLEARPLPYRIAAEYCATESCERGELQRPIVFGDHLIYGVLRLGWVPEIVSEEPPIFLVNEAFEEELGCPAANRRVQLGNPGDTTRSQARPCMHRLERAGTSYFGIFGDGTELALGRFNRELQLEAKISLTATIGEPPGAFAYFNRSMAFDPVSNLLALSIASVSFDEHLLLVDPTNLEIVRASRIAGVAEGGEPLSHAINSIQPLSDGWLYVDDLDDTISKSSPDDLDDVVIRSRRTRDVRGRSELGVSLAGQLGPFQRGVIVANMALEGDELLFLEETDQELVIRGSARSITERELTPTELAWAGDLIAVGLTDRELLEAHLGFMDPKTLRFLPGTILVGRGVIARIRYTGDRLWLALPWEGKLVELEHADPR